MESKRQVCLYAKEEREEIIFLDLKFLFTVDGYTGELCSHFSMASWFAFPSGVESNLKLPCRLCGHPKCNLLLTQAPQDNSASF